MAFLPASTWQTLESIVRRDPGGRGVAGCRVDGNWLLEGHLQTAAEHLAAHARAVAIVTGFAIVDGDRAVAETDGPPGALYLARALVELGVEVVLISDAFGVPLLHAGCDCLGLPRQLVLEFPFEDGDPSDVARTSNEPAYLSKTNEWVDLFLQSPFGRRLTHLISIERVGPCHTEASLASQICSGPSPVAAFLQAVPRESHDHCYSMRGQPISGWTAKTHRLFEIVRDRNLPVTTIGIGDGGNELGMGAIPWEILRRAIQCGEADRIPCRIAADFCILTGVSNWGGYGLALAVTAMRDRLDLAKPWDREAERQLLEFLVENAGAIDGVTRRREPTVDGLPQSIYLETLASLRESLGLPG